MGRKDALFILGCPNCGAGLTFEDGLPEGTIRCPDCDTAFPAPKPPGAPNLSAVGCLSSILASFFGIGYLFLWLVGLGWLWVPYLCVIALMLNSRLSRAVFRSCYQQPRGQGSQPKRHEQRRQPRKTVAEKLTTEMWEALSETARQRLKHPEWKAWDELIQAAIKQHGHPLVTVGDLAKIKQIEPRNRLTKKQSEQLSDTALHLRLAIEPDARMTGKTYAWDEVVALFPRRDESANDPETYRPAAILLRLSLTIAVADGEVDEAELSNITAYLEQQFQLTPTEAERLEHLQHVLVHSSPSSRGTIDKSLRELHPEQRQIIGEFLVAIAVADGTISPQEQKALKKAWQALGLTVEALNELLAPPAQGSAPADAPFVLDRDRVAHIMQDTQRVATMLQEAMSVDEEEPDESPQLRNIMAPKTVVPIVEPSATEPPASVVRQATVAETVTNWPGLAPRYHDFLRHLITHPVWQRRELDTDARSRQLMLGGALETINEWSHELHGDWLTSEEGDEIHVQQGLLKGEAE